MKKALVLLISIWLLSVSAVLVGESECGEIEGNALLGLSHPLAEVSVSATSRMAHLYFDDITDVNGHYKLEMLPAGNYQVFADANGYGCVLIPHLIVGEGQHVRQDFHFHLSQRRKGCDSVER
jgi:Carboxypeptidase regulatory-like domain